MPIPQDILSVPRPKNTVVIAYGKDKSLYAVRQRIGCRTGNASAAGMTTAAICRSTARPSGTSSTVSTYLLIRKRLTVSQPHRST